MNNGPDLQAVMESFFPKSEALVWEISTGTLQPDLTAYEYALMQTQRQIPAETGDGRVIMTITNKQMENLQTKAPNIARHYRRIEADAN